MLHHETVAPGTLDILKALSGHAALQHFHLAGGTSLALRFGHRLSVDLDFFCTEPFNNEDLSTVLVQDFGFDERRRGETGIAGSIAGVRLDLVKYRYPLIAAPEIMEGIRFISLPDVVAMKLSAVTNRGAKKDFYDLQMLITQFGLPTLFEHYQKKYPQAGMFMLARSMSHFDDAEDEDDKPVSLIGMSWEAVKKSIQDAVQGMM